MELKHVAFVQYSKNSARREGFQAANRVSGSVLSVAQALVKGNSVLHGLPRILLHGLAVNLQLSEAELTSHKHMLRLGVGLESAAEASCC